MRQLWIKATWRQNWEPTKFTRICSRHFEENCFRKTQHLTLLNKSSVPTLHIAELNPDRTATNVQEVEQPSTATIVSGIDTEPCRIPPMEKPSTSTEAMDLEVSSINYPSDDTTLTPRKLKLTVDLRRQSLVAEMRKKKLAAMRAKTWRINKKNAELSAILQNLKSKRYINQESADLLSTVTSANSDFLEGNKSKFSP